MKHLHVLLLLTMIFSATAFAQIPGGAVAIYPFCGNANDFLGNYNGQVVGASLTADRFGAANSAYYFNGLLGNYINLGTDAALKPLKGSVSVWVRPDGYSSHGSGYLLNPIILTKNQPGSNCYEGYAIGLVTSNGPPQIHATATQPFCNQSNAIWGTIGYQNWYHLVMTWAADSVKLYVNGTLGAVVFKGFNSAYLASDSVMVGYTANMQNNRNFLGAIDDLVIYAHTLTPAEVSQLYTVDLCAISSAAEAPTSFKAELFPNPTGDRFYLIFDQPGVETQVRIFDTRGQLRYCSASDPEQIATESGMTVDASGYEPGIYFVEVIAGDLRKVLRLERL